MINYSNLYVGNLFLFSKFFKFINLWWDWTWWENIWWEHVNVGGLICSIFCAMTQNTYVQLYKCWICNCNTTMLIIEKNENKTNSEFSSMALIIEKIKIKIKIRIRNSQTFGILQMIQTFLIVLFLSLSQIRNKRTEYLFFAVTSYIQTMQSKPCSKILWQDDESGSCRQIILQKIELFFNFWIIRRYVLLHSM